MIDNLTKQILLKKLRFTPLHLQGLEKNKVLLSQTLELIEVIKESSNQVEIMDFARIRLKKIKATLDFYSGNQKNLIKKARAEFYTFCKSVS
ncbi:MAG: hypothetical protein OEY59_07700 [Deltaproteobacteria bacterium]|nr:hypothetical protein [Deltaproteobacteria bacterium]